MARLTETVVVLTGVTPEAGDIEMISETGLKEMKLGRDPALGET